MKLKTKLMMALTLLAVACGHRGNKDVSTTKTDEKIVLKGNFDEDLNEVNTKGMKPEVNKDNGSIQMVDDHEKLFEAFYTWARSQVDGNGTLLASESDAAKLAERFKTEKVKFVIFKQAFDFAHSSEDGPKLGMDESIAYADKMVEGASQKDDKGQVDIAKNGKALLKADAEKSASIIAKHLTPAIEKIALFGEKSVTEVTDDEKAEARKTVDGDMSAELKKEFIKSAE